MKLRRMGIQVMLLAIVLLALAMIADSTSLFAQGVDPQLERDWGYMLGRYIIPGLIFLGVVAVIIIWLLLGSREGNAGGRPSVGTVIRREGSK